METLTKQPPKGPARASLVARTRQVAPSAPPVQAVPAGMVPARGKSACLALERELVPGTAKMGEGGEARRGCESRRAEGGEEEEVLQGEFNARVRGADRGWAARGAMRR